MTPEQIAQMKLKFKNIQNDLSSALKLITDASEEIDEKTPDLQNIYLLLKNCANQSHQALQSALIQAGKADLLHEQERLNG